MPLPADVGRRFSPHLRRSRPATSEPPGVSAAMLVRPSSLATNPTWHRTPRFSTGAATRNSNLAVAAYATIATRPDRANFGPSSAEELDLADGELIRARRNAWCGT